MNSLYAAGGKSEGRNETLVVVLETLATVLPRTRFGCSRRVVLFLVKICLLAWDCTSLCRLYCVQRGHFHFNRILALLNVIFSRFCFCFSLAWHHGHRSLHTALRAADSLGQGLVQVSRESATQTCGLFPGSQAVTLAGKLLHSLTS